MMKEPLFRSFLHGISSCFTRNDFEAWEARTLRPFTMITRHGPVYLTTREELRSNFDNYVKACRTMQIDTIFRTPVSLDPAGEETLIGLYQTHLLRKNRPVTDSYLSAALIHDVDDVWRISSIMGARGHHDVTGATPQSWET